MKKLCILVLTLAFLGCDNENAIDCFQTAGDIVEKDFSVDFYNRIVVWDRVQLVISHGSPERVVVQTGDNLMNQINVRVEDSILKVSDRNSCNLIRDYGITKVFVTTSMDTLIIRNSSGLAVENRGPLKFRDLTLIAQDVDNQNEFQIDGDFNLDQLDIGLLRVKANGLSTFRLKGRASFARYNLFDSDVRIEAGELICDGVSFFHRSTNDLIVNPQVALRGEIVSLGNVISRNRPPIVEVEELFRGRLIFE